MLAGRTRRPGAVVTIAKSRTTDPPAGAPAPRTAAPTPAVAFPPARRPDLWHPPFRDRWPAKRADADQFSRCWEAAGHALGDRGPLPGAIAADWTADWAADLFTGIIGATGYLGRPPATQEHLPGWAADLAALLDALRHPSVRAALDHPAPIVWLFDVPPDCRRGVFGEWWWDDREGVGRYGGWEQHRPRFGTGGFLNGCPSPDVPPVTAAVLLGTPTAAEVDRLCRFGMTVLPAGRDRRDHCRRRAADALLVTARELAIGAGVPAPAVIGTDDLDGVIAVVHTWTLEPAVRAALPVLRPRGRRGGPGRPSLAQKAAAGSPAAKQLLNIYDVINGTPGGRKKKLESLKQNKQFRELLAAAGEALTPNLIKRAKPRKPATPK